MHRSSSCKGAKAAHNPTNNKGGQEVISATDQAQPWQLADKESAKWQDIWTVNQLNKLAVPVGFVDDKVIQGHTTY